jgi:RHS repeat-associated protein
VPVTTNGSSDTNWPIQWRTEMELTPGAHQLKVSALHPSGFYTALATNFFTNNLANQAVAILRDGDGNITKRTWVNSDGATNLTQLLYFDARDRLDMVNQFDSQGNGFLWLATYDGLNRRLLTQCYPTVDFVTQVYGVTPTSVNQYYDPQAEFLELGVGLNNEQTQWKLYGPDLNGKYGGENGTGGLDAVSPYLSEFNPVISDARGDILAEVTNGVLSWAPSRPTGYGAVPGYRPIALAHGGDLAQSSAWRGHWPDITGYYQIGLRTYDPTAGMWLSYDSAWNERDPNYLTFCGGDPINGFDPDGRCAKSVGNFVYNGGPASYLLNGVGNALNNSSSGNSYLDATTGFVGTLFNEAGGAIAPSTYVNGLSSYGHNIAGYYQDPNGGFMAASSYALTSWNVGAIYSGYENFDLSYDTAGQPVGDWFQRGTVLSGGVASTAGIAAGGLSAFNWATAAPASVPPVISPSETPPVINPTEAPPMSAVADTVPKAGPLPAGEDPYQLQLFPDEPYDRVAQYGNTPTAAQRASVPSGMEFDHNPTLVEHYYEGPGDGSLPGFNLTQTERLQYGASLDSGSAATPAAQRAQGGVAAQYSRQQKIQWGLSQ